MNVEQLLFNRVMVKPEEAKEKTSGGLFIPRTIKQVPRMGIVVAVGTKCDETLKVGQLVMFGPHGGQEHYDKDIKYLIFKDDEIFAILQQPKKKKP